MLVLPQGVIKDYPIECTPEVKANLMVHMGMVHKMVTEVSPHHHPLTHPHRLDAAIRVAFFLMLSSSG